MRIMIRIGQAITIFFLPIMVYLLCAYVLTLFPSSTLQKAGEDYAVYVYHDEHILSHTEIIFPIVAVSAPLLEAFPDLLTSHAKGYIAFSYGDRGFMMDKGGFDDINVSLGLKALFLHTPALIKVGHYGGIYKNKCEKMMLDVKTIQRLNTSILKSFSQKEGKNVRYHDSFHFQRIHFYEAKEGYNLFHTCNTWTGDRLREVGLSQPLWTPFAQSVIGYNETKD